MKLGEFFNLMKIRWNGRVYTSFVLAGDAGMAARKQGSGRERRDYGRGQLLHALVRRYAPHKVLEIGTGRGYSSYCMARALEGQDRTFTITSIDIIPPDKTFEFMTYPDGSVNTCFAALLAEHLGEESWRIKFKTGRSIKVLPKLKGPYDLIFVDGKHKKKAVISDIDWALRLSHPGTVICLHDYKNHRTPEVTAAIVERLDKLAVGRKLFEVVTEGYPGKHGIYEVLDTDSCILVCLPTGTQNGV